MIFGRKYTVTCLFLPSDSGVGVGGGAGHQFPLNSSVSSFYVHRGTDLKQSIIWAEDSEWHPQNRPDVSFHLSGNGATLLSWNLSSVRS